MIVVDASVIAFLMIEGELTDAVRELHRIDPDWITPPILNHEMLNILAAVGSAEKSSVAMEAVWRDVRTLVATKQQVPDPVRSLRLGVELGISGNEAQYLCLADSLGLPLVTQEESLLHAAPERAVSVLEYLGSLS
jgi:predicted nucleic acid-binding protein